MKQNISIIGGFLLNHKPIEFLLNSELKPQFINLNSVLNSLSVSSIDEIAEHIAVNHLGQEPDQHLVGYSFGGIIAIKIAELYPNLIKRLTLLNSTPKFIAIDNWWGIGSAKYIDMIARLTKSKNVVNFFNYFIRLAFYPHHISSGAYISWLTQDSDQEKLIKLLVLIGRADFRHNLAELLTPQKVAIYGDNDFLCPYNNLTKLDAAIQTHKLPSMHTDLNLYNDSIIAILSEPD